MNKNLHCVLHHCSIFDYSTICTLLLPAHLIVFAFDASIERVQFRGTVFGNAQVIRKVLESGDK